MGKRKIIWTKGALNQFNKAIDYIREDSDQNAESVKNKLIGKINELSDSKIVHRMDPYKINNDGNFLYFEIMKFRIVYYADQNSVSIIRIRHTSREPKNY